MATRTYVIGVPLVVEVADDGSISFEVDLSEVDVSMDTDESFDYSADQRLVDSDAAQNAAERIGNTHRFTA